MVFFLGKDILKEGLKTYFNKYKFKNTELSEFIAELSDASERLGLQINFKDWSDSWLKTAGCA
jgi:aminopeptidase N